MSETEGNPPTRRECRTIIEHTVPVRGGPWYRAWRDQPEGGSEPPESWRMNAYLRDLVLLRHKVPVGGVITPATVGGRTFLLDTELGLLIND
jgi:hypothetical protein